MHRGAHDIVVLGGSAGAIPAVGAVLDVLPADFGAAVFVSLHRQPETPGPDVLTRLFSARTPLAVQTARDEQSIEPGHVYVGPSDQHMVLENGLIRLQHSPKEHRFRPCIDVLFKSAAATYGRRVAGVLLSGACGSDGVAGLWQITHRGGATIIQDPADAVCGGMPQAAMDAITVDHVLPAAQIGPMLLELASGQPREDHAPAVRILVVENESSVASILQQSLAEMGYEAIDWVSTGEAAIDLASREPPDLILMDIHLAGALTGIETARQIWQTLQIPVVFCTAHADLETLKAVQTTESYGYLVRPFQSSAVRAAVELALARREKELR